MRTERTAAVLLAFAVLLFSASPVYARTDSQSISAQAAVLMEVTTRRVLMYDEAHEKMPMASTTKVMTAIIALENCETDEMVATPEEAYGEEGSSIYLNHGEKLSMEDMLYGLMLCSGNDAAVAIAVHVGGSVEGFVKLMNEKAGELGCVNTHFVTPNGLPNSEHYTTAYDLALISAYAFENEAFRSIVSSQYHRTKTGDYVRTMKNKNKLLWQYEGAIGGKTGYTKAAGKCLVFAAERNGMIIVGVVLNSPDMFNDAIKLLDKGFAEYHMQRIADRGDFIAGAYVWESEKLLLELCAAQDIIIPVKVQGEEFSARVSVNGGICAPVSMGERLGKITVCAGDTVIGEYPLVAGADAQSAGFGHYWKRAVNGWTA